MSVDLVVHAIVTVRGDAQERAACREHIARALQAQALAGEVSEHHGPGALAYDLKIKGGLPFPAFVDVSQAYPGLTITVEWVSVEAGQRGTATLAGGRLAQRDMSPLDDQSRDPVCVRIGSEGRLVLACALLRYGPDECRGYAIEGERDAAFRAARLPGGAMELVATEGAAAWAARWRTGPGEVAVREALDPPEPIPEEAYAALDRLARQFAAEWLWFAADAEQAVAIERERLRRRGHVERAANVRAEAFARVEQRGREAGAVLVYDTIPEALRWVEALLTRCWVENA